MSAPPTHAPTAPELPTTSQGESANSAQWQYFGSGSDTVISKPTAPDASEMPSTTTKMLTSSTAYSFAGSALGIESTDNLNEKPKEPSTSSTETKDSTTTSNNDEEKHDDSMYECNICLDTAKDAVVSMCGHLFCWPCLHQWLETRPNRKLCPVCKASIGKDKVIPLYGRNSTKQEDPRNKVPPRPAGQRIEPEPQQGFGFGDGFHMSFGIGAFPFGYFASSFNFGEPRPAPANRGTTQFEDEHQLSKLFLYLAFLCIAWLLFA